MIQVVYTDPVGLSIIAVDETIKIIDNDLNCYYESDISDAFYRPRDTYDAFIKATDKYFDQWEYKQYKDLALKTFGQSEFVSQMLDWEKQHI